jgi:hypothetical protein
MPAPSDLVFDVVHDYNRRLEWDTMLREARLLDGAVAAGSGVRSRCAGTWMGLFLALETEYIQFSRGVVAAVQLTNRPLLFGRFAATIRHRPASGSRSLLSYTYSFRARPRWLAPILEPVMNVMMRRETRRRLQALSRYLEGRGA